MDLGRPAAERADLLVREMTLDEKVSMLHAVSDSAHARETLPIRRLCIPALRLNNGSAGVGSGGPVQPQATALPAPLGLAASFDPAVAFRYGAVMGRETRSIGRNLQEGPDINLARVPLNGRTFEAYGEDPHLAGEIAAGTVRGIQSEGTIGEPKHYLANNQESDRNSVDERIDERTLREIYLPAFEAAVKQGGAGAVMCAKNKINGSYACEHDELLQRVLKDEWGFRGLVVSDFIACHDTIRCAFGGLDFELPSGVRYGHRLKAAVKADQVPRAVLDDHVHRVLETMLRFGLFERQPGTRPIDAARGGADSRAAAEAGTVLLKNERGVLPLDTQRDRSIALIGPGSHTAVAIGGGSTGVAPPYTVSPLQAIRHRVGSKATINAAHGMGPVDLGPQPALPANTVQPKGGGPGDRGWTARYYDNTTWSGDPVLTRTDQWVDMDPSGGIPAPGLGPNGWSIRWTATFTAPADGDYTFHLTNFARAKLFFDGSTVIDNGGGFPGVTKSATVHLRAGQPHAIRVDWAKASGQAMIELAWTPPANAPNVEIDEAAEAARKSDVAVVFVANKDTEGIDRPDLSLPGHQDALVQAVAAANPRTVVVLNTGSPVTMPWLDDVAGVLEMWYPGEEAGNAAASVLFGDTNPSGKLPITFPKRLADTPTSRPEQYPGVGGKARVLRGPERRLPPLRQPGRRAAVPVRLRPVVHAVPARRLEGQRPAERAGEGDGRCDEHGRPARRRSRAGVRRRRRRRGRPAAPARGLCQGRAGSRRAPQGHNRSGPARLRTLGQRPRRLGPAGGLVHDQHGHILPRSAAARAGAPRRGGGHTPLNALKPPSTGTIVPVTKLAPFAAA